MPDDLKENADEELSFSFNKANTFKDIAMAHLRRITEVATCEFRGGYFLEITTKDGSKKEVYIEDTRERYNNAVLTLAHLLFPKFDKTTTTKYEKFQEDLKELKEEFIKNSTIDEKEILGEGFYENEKDKISLEEFRIQKLRLFQDLFLTLSILLSVKNYFEMGGETF